MAQDPNPKDISKKEKQKHQCKKIHTPQCS